MPIISDKPITTPATTEKIYNMWWISRLEIDGSHANNGTVSIKINFRLCYIDKGKPVFHPTEPDKELVIPDMFGFIDKNEALTKMVNDVIDCAGYWGKLQKVIQ